jgi:hypothetical protein
MRVVPVTLTCAAVLLAGCGAATAPGTGTGTSAPASSTTGRSPAPPPAVPAANGPVTGVGTVLEVPSGSPELCVGPVMESYPPQCEGIPLAGWDWDEAGVQEEVPAGPGSATRWGTYAVTGPFDGLGMTVTDSVPLALYDTVAQPSPRPVAPPALTPEQWAAVEAGVRLLPGLLTSAREGAGPVHVEVVHDDGSLQDWADAAFGAGAVRVTSALR